MKERSLIAFTLLAQLAVGIFWALAAVWWAAPFTGARVHGPLWAVGPVLAVALLAAFQHLGTPRNAGRALSNLRNSWLSRELMLALLFGAGWLLAAITPAPVAVKPAPRPALSDATGLYTSLLMLTALLGVGLVYAMSRVYRVRTVPAWNTRLTTLAFFLTTASLGTLGAAAVFALGAGTRGGGAGPSREVVPLVGMAALALLMELVIEPLWWAVRQQAAGEVDAGLNPVTDTRAARWWRVGLLVSALLLAWVALAAIGTTPWLATGAVVLGFGVVLVAAVVGRAGLYASHARRGM